jgi:hypothetical protein
MSIVEVPAWIGPVTWYAVCIFFAAFPGENFGGLQFDGDVGYAAEGLGVDVCADFGGEGGEEG